MISVYLYLLHIYLSIDEAMVADDIMVILQLGAEQTREGRGGPRDTYTGMGRRHIRPGGDTYACGQGG